MNKRCWSVLWLLAAIRTLFNTSYRMIYPFLGTFARALGVPLEEMGWVLSARSLVGAGAAPLLSRIPDVYGRRVGMLWGLGAFSLSLLLVVFWPSFWGLAAALIASTAAKYLFDPAMQAYLGDRVPYAQRGLALSVTEMGWSVAFMGGIPLMGFVIARLGWLAPFPLLSLLGGLSLFALWRVLPADKPTSADGAGVRWRAVFTSPVALAGLFFSFFASSANEVVNLLFGVWLEASFGLQIAALGAASAVIGLSELGGEGLVAVFADRLGKKRAIALGLMGNILAGFLLPWLGRSVWGALLGLFLFYITFEFTLVASIPLMTELLPQARATLLAFNVTLLSLGRAVGAPIGVWLYGYGFEMVVLGAAALNGLSLFALTRVHER